MSKQEFLAKLRRELSGLPQDDIEERLIFYNEMIEDRIEDGLSEEDAVAAVGSVSEIVKQIVLDTPLSKIAKERIKPKRRMTALEIVLLVLGSPIWLSLLFAVIAVIFAVYVSLWSVIISLWAVFGSLIACVFGGIAGGIIIAITNNTLTGIAVIGAGILCAGLTIFMFYGCELASKGILMLTKKIAIWVKNCVRGKEDYYEKIN
ncbi:MAG: DUF1700 domain-containing protein [Clostridia bacterium]|nr:DUF1700 domain-containing protein [Clostridia bacterium]